MTEREALKLALEALKHTHPSALTSFYTIGDRDKAIKAIQEHLAQPEQKPVAWKYDVTHNQDGTVSVALPDGDELRIVLPNRQEPYCWTWDEFVSGGKWRAEYGWKKPTKKVVNLQPLYTTPPQRKPLTDKEKDRLANAWFSKDGDTDVAHRKAIALIEEVEAAHGIKENT